MHPRATPRPALPLAAAFALGVLAGTPAWAAAIGTAAAALLAFARLARRPGLLPVALLAGIGAAGALRYAASDGPGPRDVSRLEQGRFVRVTGVIATEVERRTWDYTCEIAVERVTLPEGRKVRAEGRVAARLRHDGGVRAPDYGDCVEAGGFVYAPRPASSPGAFDYAAWLARRGVYATLLTRTPDHWRVVRPGAAGTWPGRLAVRARASFVAVAGRLLPAPEAALLAGITLGARSRIPPAIEDAFQATGTAHVLATAGLHVGIVAAAIMGLCRLLRVRRARTALVQIGVLALFALMAGGRPSVMRAVLTADLLLLAWLLDRDSDPLNALAVAALAILACRPAYLFDPGFQLSFATVGTLLAFVPPLHGALSRRYPAPAWHAPWPTHAAYRVLEFVAVVALVSVVAQAGSAPLCAAHFGQVPLTGSLANLLIVPALFVCVPVGLGAWLLHFAWPAGAGALMELAVGPTLRYVMGAAHACAGLPAASVGVADPGWARVAAAYAALAAAAWWVRSRVARAGLSPGPAAGSWLPRAARPAAVAAGLGLALALLLGLAGGLPSRPRGLVVTFLDVGQGDAAVVRTPEGHTVVIDAGPVSAEGEDAGRRVVDPFLRAMGVRHVDVLALSHLDDDHAGGAASLLGTGRVGALALSASAASAAEARPLLQEARRHGVRVLALRRGQVLRFGGGLELQVQGPPDPLPAHWPPGGNNASLVLRATYGQARILFLGDAEAEAEAALVHGGHDLSADVLKVSHHGSLTGVTPELLDAVRPAHAVISCGRRNRFGHPHPAVVRMLELRGTRIRRTDVEGSVQVASDGHAVTVGPCPR